MSISSSITIHQQGHAIRGVWEGEGTNQAQRKGTPKAWFQVIFTQPHRHVPLSTFALLCNMLFCCALLECLRGTPRCHVQQRKRGKGNEGKSDSFDGWTLLERCSPCTRSAHLICFLSLHAWNRMCMYSHRLEGRYVA